MTLVRNVSWSTLEEKAAWLDSAASLDAGEPGVHALAVRILSRAPHRDKAFSPAFGASTQAIVEETFEFWRDRIRYERDRRLADMKRAEQFADTDTILERGFDDCDGKARGFVATIRTLAQMGVFAQARIVPVFSADLSDFKHVQAQVWWPGSDQHPRAEPDGWLLCELTLKGVPLGAGVEAASRDAKTGRLDTT